MYIFIYTSHTHTHMRTHAHTHTHTRMHTHIPTHKIVVYNCYVLKVLCNSNSRLGHFLKIICISATRSYLDRLDHVWTYLIIPLKWNQIVIRQYPVARHILISTCISHYAIVSCYTMFIDVSDVKESLVHHLASSLFSLLTTWICRHWRCMGPSLPLSWSDSIWTMVDGMTEKLSVSPYY